MKLGKIRFAKVVSWISRMTNGLEFAIDDLEELDNLIDIDVPQPQPIAINANEIDRLLYLMQESTHKVEAIRTYRALTGQGLKESKDAVEKYWTYQQQPIFNPEDVLYKALKSGKADAEMQLDTANWLLRLHK